MRTIIQKLSRCKLVFLITLTALIMAISTDYGLAKLFGHDINFSDLLRASIIPLIIAPFVSWYFVGLIYRLDEAERRMTSLARLDGLTRLLNRRAFYEEYDQHRFAEVSSKGAFVLLDLDHFKRVNDEFSHLAGDAVLKAIAHQLTDGAPKGTVVARIGGEEFALLLPLSSLSLIEQHVEALLKAIRALSVSFEQHSISITASAGVYIFPEDGNITLNQAYQHADRALYVAKESGRDRFVIANLEP